MSLSPMAAPVWIEHTFADLESSVLAFERGGSIKHKTLLHISFNGQRIVKLLFVSYIILYQKFFIKSMRRSRLEDRLNGEPQFLLIV